MDTDNAYCFSGLSPPDPVLKVLTRLTEEMRALRKEVAALRSAPQHGAPVLTVEAAATRLGCSRSRVFELLAEGKLTRAPKHGRRQMVTIESVDQLLIAGLPPKPRRRARKPAVLSETRLTPAELKASILKLPL